MPFVSEYNIAKDQCHELYSYDHLKKSQTGLCTYNTDGASDS